MPCEEAIEKAKAADLAVTAGAIRETVQIIDMEDEDTGCGWFEK